MALAAQSVGETHRMTINCIYDQGAIFMVFLGNLSPHPTQKQKNKKKKKTILSVSLCTEFIFEHRNLNLRFYSSFNYQSHQFGAGTIWYHKIDKRLIIHQYRFLVGTCRLTGTRRYLGSWNVL